MLIADAVPASADRHTQDHCSPENQEARQQLTQPGGPARNDGHQLDANQQSRHHTSEQTHPTAVVTFELDPGNVDHHEGQPQPDHGQVRRAGRSGQLDQGPGDGQTREHGPQCWGAFPAQRQGHEDGRVQHQQQPDADSGTDHGPTRGRGEVDDESPGDQHRTRERTQPHEGYI